MPDLADAIYSAMSASTIVQGLRIDRVTVRPCSDVQATNMEGETVLLHLGSGRYYTLNVLGSIIWDQCTGGATIKQIHDSICERFQVTPERALDDLIAMLRELEKEDLVELV
jgi:hypothetical protein